MDSDPSALAECSSRGRDGNGNDEEEHDWTHGRQSSSRDGRKAFLSHFSPELTADSLSNCPASAHLLFLHALSGFVHPCVQAML